MNDPQFVPSQVVVYSFDELCVIIRNQYAGDADIYIYIDADTYIGEFSRNVPRRPPLFTIEL